MSWKHNIPTLVVYFTHLGFAGLFAYLSWLAVDKYIRQPTATYISYTNGDDNVNLRLPQLAFCTYTNNLTLPVLHNELKSSLALDLDVQNFVERNTPNISNIIVSGHYIWHWDSSSRRSLDRSLFFPIYHSQYGSCIGLDLSHLQIDVNEVSSSYLAFQLNFSTVGERVQLLYHSQYDFPDAKGNNPPVTTLSERIYTIKLRKRITTAESTNAIPCGDFDKNTCHSIQATTEVSQKFGCKIPFLYSGKHLEKYVSGYRQLPACRSEVLIEAIELFMKMPNSCKQRKACKSTKYGLIVQQEPNAIRNVSEFWLAFNTFEVEHYTTYVSYDELSLMAELGGLLGMTLGFSFASIGDVLASIIKRNILKIE